MCRRCRAEEETSAHVLRECEVSAALRHAYLGSFLEPGDIKSVSLGAIWNFSKVTGPPPPINWCGAQRAHLLRPRNIGTMRSRTQLQSINCKVEWGKDPRGVDVLSNYLASTVRYWGVAVAQWLRSCATNRKVTGLIAAGVSGYFIDIKSFWSHYGPGVDSASNRNEYQEYFLEVNEAGA